MVIKKKIVVVGDGACGKTCLSVAFCKNEFPEEHVPTIYDTYVKTATVENEEVELTVQDTAGEEDYDRLRPLNYSGTNVVLVCFSIANPVSLDNVIEKWAPELKHYCRKAPLILVGTKMDLRTDPSVLEELTRTNAHPVTYDEAMKVAKKINARDYIESSAKYMMGVKDAFLKAAQLSLENKERSHCLPCIPKS